MKTDYEKIFFKAGRESKWDKAEKAIIGGKPLGDILKRAELLENAYHDLIDTLKGCHIIQKEKAYILNIDGELKKVTNLDLVEYHETKLPLTFYKVENGQLVEDKEKVGAM